MKDNTMQTWLYSSYLTGTNQSYIEELYKKFLHNPTTVDTTWCTIFNHLSDQNTGIQKNEIFKDKPSLQYSNEEHFSYNHNFTSRNIELNSIQERVLKLIDSYRLHGHKHANLDPLKINKRNFIENLDINFYKFSENDLQKNIHVGSFFTSNKVIKLIELYKILQETYCNSIGFEYMHLNNKEEILWIQKNIESNMGKIFFNMIEKKQLLHEIIKAEKIEQYLAVAFPGTKRFSLEGSDVLTSMLHEVIQYAARNKIKKIILNMAHRGRLNVLVNVLNKPPRDLFEEFSNQYRTSIKNYSGDVKYHQGFFSKIKVKHTCVDILLLPNPSHLEIINPVAMGITRAHIDALSTLNVEEYILPISIHGDASIIGQGITQETLNMSDVPAYNVGGTVRIVINNQIGFTISNIHHLRSSEYCTDIGKMISIPIFHVNADDPEKVIFVLRTALNFRNVFKRDVLIDLICYRRHGHNEVDEPSVTQPLMYRTIRQHPTLYQSYSNHLKNEGIIDDQEIMRIIDEFQSFLNTEKIHFEKKLCNLINKTMLFSSSNILKSVQKNDKILYSNVELNHLQKLAYSISSLPKNFKTHPRVNKIYQERMKMAKGEKYFDWGGAEVLAYATLLNHGISVRLSGEDTARGTFFHRHAIIYDQDTGVQYIPLENIHKQQGKFFIWDSVLSEEGALAFEYGYSLHSSFQNLVIWEAQFGDFANGAQIVIDQFISSGKQKWKQDCNLIMLLPHGYEGQGPEHSSARIERYLQLCAENNMKVCVPSTPSQIYHLLRHQALCKIRIPLIIISPKSLLRHKMVFSSFDELTQGDFQKIIEDKEIAINNKNVKRILMCSGKIYYDLVEHRQKNEKYDTVIIRIEQLYPFPIKEIRQIFSLYDHVKNFIWCQEEPKNQGAWYHNKNYFHKIIPNCASIYYIGRPASAAPAVGCFSLHQKEQKTLLDNALNLI